MKKKEESTFFNKKNIMSFIIVFLMVSSILAIWQGTSSSSDVPSYNDHDISLDGNKYKIESEYGPVYGYTYPSVLETYSFDSSFTTYLLSSPTALVLFDPTDPGLAYIEVLRLDLGQEDFPTLGKSVSFAVTEETTAYPYPVVSCASTSVPTLYLRTDNTTNSTSSIFQDGGCIVLSATTWQELVQLKDRVVYGLAGIME